VSDEVDPIEEMNELHVDLGRKAAELAMQVLESASVADIPIATAVALLKFGVELERKALLGAEADDDGGDAFDALAGMLAGQPPTPDEKPPKED
jgi:hypothetical protein